jgi:hypothetical protein
MGWVVSVTPPPRFTSRKGPPVPTGQGAGWAPQPVWTQKLQEKSFRLCRGSYLDRPVVQPVARHYTDWVTRLTIIHLTLRKLKRWEGYYITVSPPWYRYSFIFRHVDSGLLGVLSRSQWHRGPRLWSWPLVCWVCGFESLLGYGCLHLCLCVVLPCDGRGISDELITRPKESYHVSNKIRET